MAQRSNDIHIPEKETMAESTTTDEQNPRASRQLPDNADPAVDYATAADRPGTLRGEASLLIQTRQAQRLVYGRRHSQEQAGIIGLVRFGMLMKRIWTSATLDDPYADWFLIQIHESLESGRETIRELKAQVDALLQAVEGVDITVAHSLKPVRVPLQFANPYGYMGAYLIADYDELVRAVLTARHVGLLPRDTAEQMLQRGGRTVRRTFVIPTQWKHCAISRDDLRLDTPHGRAAREAMGELPQDVLDGTCRAGHAPTIRKAAMTRAAVVSDNTSEPMAPTSEVSDAGPVATDKS